jgi:hypothetical protein
MKNSVVLGLRTCATRSTAVLIVILLGLNSAQMAAKLNTTMTLTFNNWRQEVVNCYVYYLTVAEAFKRRTKIFTKINYKNCD